MTKIYHLHLRKTAGRSVHHAVFASTGQESRQVYLNLSTRPGDPMDVGGIKLGGWVSDLTKDFGYGYSHEPIYKLYGLTPDIFMVCCFRDPVARFVSYWKMLRDYIDRRASLPTPHASLEEEIKAYDDDLVKCFQKTADIHRLNQIYMFSASGNLIAAKLNLRRMNLIMETEDLQAGMDCLGNVMERDLGIVPKIGPGKAKATLDFGMRRELKAALKDEYLLIADARTLSAHYTALAHKARTDTALRQLRTVRLGWGQTAGGRL